MLNHGERTDANAEFLMDSAGRKKQEVKLLHGGPSMRG